MPIEITEEKIQEQTPPTDKPSEEEHTPPEGSKRWNDLYYKAKSAERQVEQDQIMMEQMRSHNQQLSESLEETRKTTHTQSNNGKGELEQQKIQAYEEGNYALASQIEAQIRETSENSLLNKIDEQIKTREKKAFEIKTNNDFRNTMDDFTLEAPWFNQRSPKFNVNMAIFAEGLDNRLSVENPQMPPNKRLQKVKEGTERTFNYKETAIPTVEHGGSIYPDIGKDISSLSEAQKQAAHRFFPDISTKEAEKKYTNQLKKMRK